jgi:hypothetical protein
LFFFCDRTSLSQSGLVTRPAGERRADLAHALYHTLTFHHT